MIPRKEKYAVEAYLDGKPKFVSFLSRLVKHPYFDNFIIFVVVRCFCPSTRREILLGFQPREGLPPAPHSPPRATRTAHPLSAPPLRIPQVLNTVTLAMDHQGITDETVHVLTQLNVAFSVVFLCEMVLKIVGLGFKA